MKHMTFIVFNMFDEIHYFIIDGDHSELKEIYINQVPENNLNQSRQKRLEQLIFNSKGEISLTKHKLKYWANELRTHTGPWSVIECGFLL